MDFSPQQQVALDKVEEWLRDKTKQLFILTGGAGTGKTTLAKYIASGVANVLYAAYTGKAALSMRRSGCDPVSTIHSLIYVPKSKSNARLLELGKARAMAEAREEWEEVMRLDVLMREENINLTRPNFTLNLESPLRTADLLIVDEFSTIGTTIAEDLLSFGVPILALGDLGQLPPVQDSSYFDKIDPDVQLTEIHRQAAGSPIIQMATEVRTHGKLLSEEYGDCKVISKGLLTVHDLADFDQILVGRNITKRKINDQYREVILGFGTNPLPMPGDKLVCTRNNHDLGILNGEQFTTIKNEVVDQDQMLLSMRSLDGSEFQALAHRHPFENREIPFYEQSDANHFDFGYAMTVHKAQGSEWDNVLLVDESHVFRKDAAKHLYTGITRAAKKLTISR